MINSVNIIGSLISPVEIFWTVIRVLAVLVKCAAAFWLWAVPRFGNELVNLPAVMLSVTCQVYILVSVTICLQS